MFYFVAHLWCIHAFRIIVGISHLCEVFHDQMIGSIHLTFFFFWWFSLDLPSSNGIDSYDYIIRLLAYENWIFLMCKKLGTHKLSSQWMEKTMDKLLGYTFMFLCILSFLKCRPIGASLNTCNLKLYFAFADIGCKVLKLVYLHEISMYFSKKFLSIKILW